ncbi:hypothetical protein LEP1GSC185_3961 [Leptospira licerasiae serovar Varillal str. VAR 010]|nr:hypothetical protein LEP1GSC185_3961 [Leptospira licerasiae serovar Varillal str. VAR 010]
MAEKQIFAELSKGVGRRETSFPKFSTSYEIENGPLNPDWVEWLMGWPVGWTGLKPLETAKYHAWFNSHGLF